MSIISYFSKTTVLWHMFLKNGKITDQDFFPMCIQINLNIIWQSPIARQTSSTPFLAIIFSFENLSIFNFEEVGHSL